MQLLEIWSHIQYYNANSIQRRYSIRHWIPMFFGTPCITGEGGQAPENSLNTGTKPILSDPTNQINQELTS